MSGMPWFRMYSEMVDDPKVGKLPDAEFRLWVELLCLACSCGENGDTGMTVDDLNWKLRRNVSETLLKLEYNKLIITHETNERKTIGIKNWEKRQFPSDKSTGRVRKYRENKQIINVSRNVTETLQKRNCNGVDTDTDTDTDTDINKTPISPLPKKQKSTFAPPTIQEVESFFSEKGYSLSTADKAFEYYSTADWKDSKGNKVQNWKQKMISVWFKEENRDHKPKTQTICQSHQMLDLNPKTRYQDDF